jgi:hypothetical protein
VVHELTLPLHELDPAIVLAARAVLREEAHPALPVRRDLHVGVSRLARVVALAFEPMHAAPRIDCFYRFLALRNDAGIPKVQVDSDLVDTSPVRRDSPVTEVEAQEIDVRRGQAGETVRNPTTDFARVSVVSAAFGNAPGDPVANRPTGDPSLAGDCGSAKALRAQLQDGRYILERTHLAA